MSERTGGRPAARLPLLAALVVVTSAVLVTSANGATGGGDAAAVVARVNEERAAADCSPVTVDDRLTTAARNHSRDQADRTEMSHAGSDGSTVADRTTAAGYQWSRVAENVAMGPDTADAAMDRWMRSDGHRENILDCDFRHIGVAHVGDYWTQVFGIPE